MPMIQFVPDTLILSGEVNANFQNAVSVDTPRSVTASHTWTARQQLLGGVLVGTGPGNAAEPSLAFELDGSFGPVGFYHKEKDLIGVAGRLDLPGFGVVAGNGILVSGGNTTPFKVTARRSADGGNALTFGSDGGLFVSPGEVFISTDPGNELQFGTDGGLLAPPFRSFLGVKGFGVGATVPASDAYKLVHFHAAASQGGSLNMEASAEWPTNSWIYVGGHETFNTVLNAPPGATFTTCLGTAATGQPNIPIPSGKWAIVVKATADVWWALRAGS